jgi:tRNA U34 2-thiouridine synthase MnmA/TrmU
MTKIRIQPGACGMLVTVEVKKKDKKTFTLTITSECKMAEKLGAELPELNFMDAFKRVLDNPVYTKGATCLKHVACPVPSGILKALEVEAGLAVPRDVSIVFEKDTGD